MWNNYKALLTYMDLCIAKFVLHFLKHINLEQDFIQVQLLLHVSVSMICSHLSVDLKITPT